MSGEFVLNADLVELLDNVRLDADAHVLGALNEQGLVNQIAECIFLTVFDERLQLLRGAAVLAVGLGILFGSDFRVYRARSE